jgi:aryl-alcohol dehydrogenase-like predicted oxidoreductase
LNERHSDKTASRILAAYRCDIVEAPKRNPIVNPEKKNLKRLESEQSHLDFAICREMLLCHSRPFAPLWCWPRSFSATLYPGDPNGGGAGRKAILAQCEQSLRRLQTDYIDLYWLHMNDCFTPIEETLRALDDLVASGKVRYIGFSDTPAWRAAQAQTIAYFRGWAPLISLQIEYSLLERTVEGELMPMAQEMGLGVTPWGPLKGGALSGKYTRENRGEMKSDRGDHVAGPLTDHDYDLLDELQKIAKELSSTVAAVSLAWVQGRPGVISTIIGARTMKQLDSNLAALELPLSADQIERLDKLSEPKLNFPAPYMNRAPSFSHAGATVNGIESTLLPFAPKDLEDHY